METQRCGACKHTLPAALFSPSHRGHDGTWCRACTAAYARGEQVKAEHSEKTCATCGTTYRPRQLKGNSKYCSRPCKDRARKDADKLARLVSKSTRRCIWCGDGLAPRKRADAAFCSEKCVSAARRQLRAVFGRGERAQTERKAWLESRGGCCHLCDRLIDPALSYPQPQSLTVDHVIPISVGGTSEIENLMPAHLACNAGRGARLLSPV